MGRRAKKAPVQTKKRATLAKRFKCPFCANDQAVECKMDFRAGIGSLACRLCAASYQMPIHHLHEPVDVFSEWLDDCEAAAQGRPTSQDTPGAQVPRYESENDDADDDDDNDDLPAPSGLTGNKNKSKEKESSPQVEKTGNDDDDDNDDGNNNAASRPSYNDLGLDDSDDDSD